jgi:hypothetical protein
VSPGARVLVQRDLLNIKFLLTIFKEAAVKYFVWCAGKLHIYQTGFSL